MQYFKARQARLAAERREKLDRERDAACQGARKGPGACPARTAAQLARDPH